MANNPDSGDGREIFKSFLLLLPSRLLPPPRRRRLSMTKETAISATAATLPTTGAAIHALEDAESPPESSWSGDVSGIVSPEAEVRVVLGVGKKKGREPAVMEEDGMAVRRSEVVGIEG